MPPITIGVFLYFRRIRLQYTITARSGRCPVSPFGLYASSCRCFPATV